MPAPPHAPPSRYHALKEHVLNRGVPPDAFLDQLVAWGRAAPDDIFVLNAIHDVYSSVVGVLGPWQDLNHRRAAMLEVMRVLAGSNRRGTGTRAAIRQTRPRSLRTPLRRARGRSARTRWPWDEELKDLVMSAVRSLDGDTFQEAMKTNHPLAMEYIARLLRRTVDHNGPVKRHEIDEWLRPDAVEEFLDLLSRSPTQKLLARGSGR